MTLVQQVLLTRTEPQEIHDPLTHPQVIHDLDRLLVLHRDVHRDVVVETGTHWELLRQGRPVVFPAWNRRERAAVELAAQDPEAFLPLQGAHLLTRSASASLSPGGPARRPSSPAPPASSAARRLPAAAPAFRNSGQHEETDAAFDAGTDTTTFFCGCE